MALMGIGPGPVEDVFAVRVILGEDRHRTDQRAGSAQQHDLRQPSRCLRWRSRSRSAPRGIRGAGTAAHRPARSIRWDRCRRANRRCGRFPSRYDTMLLTRGRPQNEKIEAIVKPFKLDEVREALSEVGVTG